MTCISTRDDESNFAWHFEGPIDILLDGKKVFGCCEADDEKGYVVQFKRDDRGDLVIIDGEIQTIRVSGKVEIVGKRRQLKK